MAPTRSHGTKSIRTSATPRNLMAERSKEDAWSATVITLFPELFPGALGASLTGKALAEGLWSLDAVDLRRFGEGKHRNVDDTPAGGGAGMVLRADIVGQAVDRARAGGATGPLVYLSPRGRRFDQTTAARWADGPGLTLICGRFEGLDERLIEAYDVEEISIGDYVLSGGETAAQVLIDACVRLIPRVLGNRASAESDSFSDGLLEHPHYTRPTVWQGRAIPDILLSGHHAKITDWRRAMAERLTKERRPDLWRAYRETHGGDPDGDRELSERDHLRGTTAGKEG